MKHTITVFILLILLLGFYSCSKNNESIRRDVIVSQKSSAFIIPITTDTLDDVIFGKIPMTLNLDSLIKVQDEQFGIENISSIKISGFKVELTDTNSANTFANFNFMNAQIVAVGKDSVELASINSIQEVAAKTLTIPVVNQSVELRSYLLESNYSYILSGVLRHKTTKTLTSIITPQFTITLNKEF